jgi:DNA polymerase (family 10)
VEAALENPHVRCLSHPTGRLINRRPENAVDLDRVYALARERGVALEVNRDAIAAGVAIVCSTDAHSVRGLDNMELAVRTARRGRATAADVLNTRPLASLLGAAGRAPR